ncbi:MAG: lactonase family protein [Weeksellaceae bacterium]|nr:lactonase family protein [Weeksellaceae bacterium]
MIANQDNRRIHIFTRNLKNGLLTAIGKSIPVCSLVNVIFIMHKGHIALKQQYLQYKTVYNS